MNLEHETIDILPTRLYRPAHLETLLGKRCLQNLRNSGLRAIGGWYSGQTILESFHHAWQNRSCQRVLSLKGGQPYEDAQKEMDKNRQDRKFLRVQKHTGSQSLRSQLEAAERKLQQKTV